MIDKSNITLTGKFVCALLVIGTCAFVSHLVVRPYLIARSSLTDLETGISLMKTCQGEMDLLAIELDQATSVEDRIATVMPQEINLDEFLADLGEFGKSAEVRIDFLSPNELDTTELYRKLNLDIQVTGNFLNIYRFINRLEQVEQLARVEDLRFSTPRGSSSCIASLTLALYFSPEVTG
jgi:Pilus assembly protein, PilO